MAISKLPRVNSLSYINSQPLPGITWKTAYAPQLCMVLFEQFSNSGRLILPLCLYPGTVYFTEKTEPIMTSWQKQDAWQVGWTNKEWTKEVQRRVEQGEGR